VDDFGRTGNITCHGFDTYLLACGDGEGRVKLIHTQKRILVRNMRCRDLVTSISMNEDFILVGSSTGDVCLFDRQGIKKHQFLAAGQFVHSTSIYGSRFLAATEQNVYSWELESDEQSFSTISRQRRSEHVAWACFHPLVKGRYLIGVRGHWPRRNKDFRPILRNEYDSQGREYMLSVRKRVWGSSVVCVRDIYSGQLIRQVLLKKSEAPEMLWLGPNRLFAIYPDSNSVMKAEFCIGDKGVQRHYLESVALGVAGRQKGYLRTAKRSALCSFKFRHRNAKIITL
jgi:hypothetical protein